MKTDGKYYHYFIVLNLIPDQKGLKCFITLNHLVTVLVKFKKYLKRWIAANWQLMQLLTLVANRVFQSSLLVQCWHDSPPATTQTSLETADWALENMDWFSHQLLPIWNCQNYFAQNTHLVSHQWEISRGMDESWKSQWSEMRQSKSKGILYWKFGYKCLMEGSAVRKCCPRSCLNHDNFMKTLFWLRCWLHTWYNTIYSVMVGTVKTKL